MKWVVRALTAAALIAAGPPALDRDSERRMRYFVTDLVDDLRAPRSPNEMTAAASRVSAEDAKELRVLAAATKHAKSGPGLDDFIACDRAFHRKLSEHSGNSVLSDFAQQLHERSIRYWYLHLWQTMDVEATTRQHVAIADAIARHDGERAASAMREHIDSLKGRLMQVKDATRRYGEPPIR